MKKTYISPVIEIQDINIDTILAGSGSTSNSGIANYKLGIDGYSNAQNGYISNADGNAFTQGAKDFDFTLDLDYDF